MAGSEDTCCISDDDLDLYDDFIVSGEKIKYEAKVVQKQLCQDLDAENKALKTRVSNLEHELEATKKVNLALKRNISVLYKTAKLEIEGKSSLLRDLQGRYDSLVFRRTKREIHPRDTVKIDFLNKEDSRNPSTGAGITPASSASSYFDGQYSPVVQTANALQKSKKGDPRYSQPRASSGSSQDKLTLSTECIRGTSALPEISKIASPEDSQGLNKPSTVTCEQSTKDKNESTKIVNNASLLNAISMASLKEIAKSCNTGLSNQGQTKLQKVQISDEAHVLKICKYKKRDSVSQTTLNSASKRNNSRGKNKIYEADLKPMENMEQVMSTPHEDRLEVVTNRKSSKCDSQSCRLLKMKSTQELQNDADLLKPNIHDCLNLVVCEQNKSSDALTYLQNNFSLCGNSALLSEEVNITHKLDIQATNERVNLPTNDNLVEEQHVELDHPQVPNAAHESSLKKVPSLKIDGDTFANNATILSGPNCSPANSASPSKLNKVENCETKKMREPNDFLPTAELGKIRTKNHSRRREEVNRRQSRDSDRGEKPHHLDVKLVEEQHLDFQKTQEHVTVDESSFRKVQTLKSDAANFSNNSNVLNGSNYSPANSAPLSKLNEVENCEIKKLQKPNDFLPTAALGEKRTEKLSRTCDKVDRRRSRDSNRVERPHHLNVNERISQPAHINPSTHRTADSNRIRLMHKRKHRHGPSTEDIGNSHVSHSRKNGHHSAPLSDKYEYVKEKKSSGITDFERKHRKHKSELSLRNLEKNSSYNSSSSHPHSKVKCCVPKRDRLVMPLKKQKLNDLDVMCKQNTNDGSKLDLEDGEIFSD